MTNSIPHIGEKIKEVFDAKQMKLKDFAEAIGVARQNVYRIFGKDSIDTDLLIIISKVLDHDFFQYFKKEHSDNGTSENIASEEKSGSDLYRELETYKNELKLAKKEIDYLKKIIELLEERTRFLLEKKNQ